MEELGIPELDSQQIEELCTLVEETARGYILSKVSKKGIQELNISVETEGIKPVTLTIDVGVSLSPSLKDLDVQHLADQAVKEAFTRAEGYLRELKCHSNR